MLKFALEGEGGPYDQQKMLEHMEAFVRVVKDATQDMNLADIGREKFCISCDFAEADQWEAPDFCISIFTDAVSYEGFDIGLFALLRRLYLRGSDAKEIASTLRALATQIEQLDDPFTPQA